VLTSTYGGFAGSESWLIEAGLVPAGSLPALKARVLLGLLLSAGANHQQIGHAFGLFASPLRQSSPGADTFLIERAGDPAGDGEGAREP
jgi:hypothetical protein